MSATLHKSVERLGQAVAKGRQQIKSVRLHSLTAELKSALSAEIRWCERHGDDCTAERQLLASIELYQECDLA